MDEGLCFPNEAWSGRSGGEAVSPVSPHVTTDGAEIQKIAKGPSHNGRETLCQQAELPISHPNSRQSTNPSQRLLLSANLCKVETTQLRSRSHSHTHTSWHLFWYSQWGGSLWWMDWRGLSPVWFSHLQPSDVWSIKSETCSCPLKVFTSAVNELETDQIQQPAVTCQQITPRNHLTYPWTFPGRMSAKFGN